MIADLLLIGLVFIAAVYDIRFRRVPNRLVVAGLIAGLVWNTYSGTALRGYEGIATGLVLYLPLYMLRARGAGDVKLLAAAGGIVGPGNCLWLFLFTALAAAAMALVLVAVKGRARRTLFNVGWMLRQLAHGRAPHSGNPDLDVTSAEGLRLPHAAAIAAGAVALVWVSHGALN